MGRLDGSSFHARNAKRARKNRHLPNLNSGRAMGRPVTLPLEEPTRETALRKDREGAFWTLGVPDVNKNPQKTVKEAREIIKWSKDFVHGDDFPPLSSDGLPENSMLSATVAAAESVPLEEAQDEGASHGRGEPTAQDVEAEV